MKYIINVALNRPYTFIVLAVLIVLMGARTIVKAPTDVFPDIKTPVVSIVWAYAGLLPSDVSGRITFLHERAITQTVEGVKYIHSNSYYGISIINVYLQPGTDMGRAEAEITAISQMVTKILPPDISPPMIMKLSPSSVPVAMIEVTSDKHSPADLYYISRAIIRPALVTIKGAILPWPYGGTNKLLLVSLDPKKLFAKNMTAKDVLDVLQEQNLILPAGIEKIGTVMWLVKNNAAPLKVKDFNSLPIKKYKGATVFLRDVGDVALIGAPQQNAVLVDGKQAIMMVVMKTSGVSTLNVVSGIKEAIPRLEKTLPKGVHIRLLNDASEFVRHSIYNVMHEMLLAVLLTGMVVLLFTGSIHSTLIIAVTIPLSILSALIGLYFLGESINVMTLGGLALAVGILVDNATVMVENIDTHRAMNKTKTQAILDAANQIVLPTFVATLCITFGWLPLFGLTGTSGWLFMPMAKAIMLAMAASFVLSITLVPTLAKYFLAEHRERSVPKENKKLSTFFCKFEAITYRCEAFLEAYRERYKTVLTSIISKRKQFIVIFVSLSVSAISLLFIHGQIFFPEIKSDTLQMHLRNPLGTRVGTSAEVAALVSQDIKKMLPGKVLTVISNCGLPLGPHNLAFIPSPTIGSQDCDLTITLRDKKSPVQTYRQILRKGLSEKYPGTAFTFQPADLTAKILNFGSPAPIDVQVKGFDMDKNYEYAKLLAQKFRAIPGTKDVVVQQTMSTPTLLTEVDRTIGLNVGLTEKNVALNTILATSGSQQFFQQFWLDHKSGFAFRYNIYTPQYIMRSLNNLLTIPIKKSEVNDTKESIELAGNVTKISVTGTPGIITHRDIMPVFDVYVSVEGRALGSVLKDVNKVIENNSDKAPPKTLTNVRGQAEVMKEAYFELFIGILSTIILVYLIMVVNFQSWLDPFIIITALLGAIAGSSVFLFLTRTYLSVPALTGLIMSVGTATANSILVVAYARDKMKEHGNAFQAAVEAGHARIRPVLMTAAAMIIGMVPMSLSNTTNAPLGKAVIGGLIVATFSTLFLVPCVYTLVYYRDKPKPLSK